MPENLKNQFPKEITLLLASVRRRIRWYVWTEGVATLVFHLGILFWVALAVDRFLEPSVAVRGVFWAAVVVAAAVDVWAVLLRYAWRPLTDRSMAVILERRFPALNDALLTVLEAQFPSFGGVAEGRGGDSPLPEGWLRSSRGGSEACEFPPLSTRHTSPGSRPPRPSGTPPREGNHHPVGFAATPPEEGNDAEFSESALRAEMLRKTLEELMAAIPALKIGEVFRFFPLRKAVFLAVLAAASVGVFAWQAPETFRVFGERIFGLSHEMYPRYVVLELEGFGKDGKIRIARGSDLEIRLKAGYRKLAEEDKDAPPKELRTVTLYSKNAEGTQNRVAMVREGSAAERPGELADFSHTFRGVLVPMTLDIYAGDAAMRDLKVEVVESPALGNMTLEVEYPAYMSQKKRTLPVSGVMSIPAGATLTLHAAANKALAEVEIVKMAGGEKSAAEIIVPDAENPTRFSWNVGRMTQDAIYLFTLKDQDGLFSRAPARVTLAREDDRVPSVAVQPYGIGSAITVNAKIPVKGKVTDDYGVREVAFEVRVERSDSPEDLPTFLEIVSYAVNPAEPHAGNPTEIVLNAEPPAVLEAEPLELRVQDKLHLSVVAEDRYDLDADFAPVVSENAEKNPARLGRSQPVILEVVTPERLRLLLEAREITLRQLYEAVYQEVLDSRDSLQRIVLEDWKNQVETEEMKKESPEHQQALQSYRVERVIQNDRKNLHEILGVAEGVENICLQMKNNRVDTPAWLERLEAGVMHPLRKIANDDFQKLEVTLIKLRHAVDRNQLAESRTLHQQSLKELDAIILAMDAVLAKMAEMQDFSEMIEILREIIHAQEEVNESTKEHHRGNLRDLEL